jgi:excisionase family DNA binding protein
MTTAAHTRSLLTVKEGAALLRERPLSVRRMIRDGRLPASRLGDRGSSIRVDERDLDAFMYVDPACRSLPGARASAHLQSIEHRRLSLAGRARAPEAAAQTTTAMTRRGTTAQKGYGASWQRLSKLARQPWCTVCGSTTDLVADHIDPATRGRRPLTLADVQVLCRRCNGSKGSRANPKPIVRAKPRSSSQEFRG